MSENGQRTSGIKPVEAWAFRLVVPAIGAFMLWQAAAVQRHETEIAVMRAAQPTAGAFVSREVYDNRQDELERRLGDVSEKLDDLTEKIDDALALAPDDKRHGRGIGR